MKKLTALLLIVLTVLLLAAPVFANSPPPSYTCTFCFENLPEGTVYVDLLIPLDETDDKYTELVRENLPNGIKSDAPIVTYAEDGFRSYSLHYKNANSSMKVEDVVMFFIDNDRDVSKLLRDDVLSRGGIRLAMISKDGAVLQVSATHELQVTSNSIFTDIIGVYRYDAKTDKLTVDTKTNKLAVIYFCLVSVIGLVFTCAMEWLMALPFDLDRKYRGLIWGTNAVSQAIMRLLDLLIRGILLLNYAYVVLILEVLVYTFEFIWYRKNMKDISLWRCLLYTIAANTASLLLGLWSYQFLFSFVV